MVSFGSAGCRSPRGADNERQCAEAVIVPSFPFESTKTAAPPAAARPLIQNPFNGVDSGENYASLSKQFVATANRRFEFCKSGQFFINTYNETLSPRCASLMKIKGKMFLPLIKDPAFNVCRN
jgi:hypothetical protein